MINEILTEWILWMVSRHIVAYASPWNTEKPWKSLKSTFSSNCWCLQCKAISFSMETFRHRSSPFSCKTKIKNEDSSESSGNARTFPCMFAKYSFFISSLFSGSLLWLSLVHFIRCACRAFWFIRSNVRSTVCCVCMSVSIISITTFDQFTDTLFWCETMRCETRSIPLRAWANKNTDTYTFACNRRENEKERSKLKVKRQYRNSKR